MNNVITLCRASSSLVSFLPATKTCSLGQVMYCHHFASSSEATYVIEMLHGVGGPYKNCDYRLEIWNSCHTKQRTIWKNKYSWTVLMGKYPVNVWRKLIILWFRQNHCKSPNLPQMIVRHDRDRMENKKLYYLKITKL